MCTRPMMWYLPHQDSSPTLILFVTEAVTGVTVRLNCPGDGWADYILCLQKSVSTLKIDNASCKMMQLEDLEIVP